MSKKCRSMQIPLNLKKCIFVGSFGTLLGHIIFKEGLMADLMKISLIVNPPHSKIALEVKNFLGYIRYQRKFIRGYATIATPLEELLKNWILIKPLTRQINENNSLIP